MDTAVRSGLRLATGLVLGACTAVAELIFVLLSGLLLVPVHFWPRGRESVLVPVRRTGRWLVAKERARLAAYLGTSCSPVHGALHGEARLFRYLATRWPVGLLGGAVLGCLALGAAYGLSLIFGWFLVDVRNPDDLILSSLAGLLLLFLAVQGVIGVATLERRLARHFLGPTPQEEMRRRIDQLFASRAGVVEAVHDERRRIERDLHDGVQQRIVALGLLLGRARRSEDPRHVDKLLRQAQMETGNALTDLREVAWRVYPVALDEGGFEAAVASVVDRSAVPVMLYYDVPDPLGKTVATVAYFVVSEAVTNTAKHADATRINVSIQEVDGILRVEIEDNGRGGAAPDGGGLTGLARRAAALDGTFDVDSPVGGPTVITVKLPCG
ncbi:MULTISPECIES: sensor histidine kinase [unclassified Streptomyces]|uniref:sensor histidine kinase n=1 Tax=unclassified Streptomyces TaxID=2593676 RepID=UPI001F4D893E|nr:histidine kinase [Streptomyces sp. AmelKG-E11A]